MYKLTSLVLLASICVFSLSGITAEDQSYIYLPGRQLNQSFTSNRSFPTWVNFEESTFLSLCDENSDKCLSFNHNWDGGSPYYNRVDFKLYSPDSNWDSYLSATRCGAGDSATTVVSVNNRTYKHCKNADDALSLRTTFQLPPDLCQTTCDKDNECVGYSVDMRGQNCLNWMKSTAEGYKHYVYMHEPSLVTFPHPSIQKIKAFAVLNSTSDSN